MDRLANADINPDPGALDGIGRNDEINVYVGRIFRHDAVSLRPGVGGNQSVTILKSSNGRMRPLYDAIRLPEAFQNRVRIGNSIPIWSGRLIEGDWAITGPARFWRIYTILSGPVGGRRPVPRIV